MCECTAIIHKEDPRYSLWVQILGDSKAEVPLKHPIPERAGGHVFYQGDPSRLSEKQIKKMAQLLSKKFSISEEGILTDLNKGILPVREPVSLSICELHCRCMM